MAGVEPIEICHRYRLDSLIAEGGMGAVYRGENIATGRPVAVKLVHAVHAENSQVVGRFKRESRATAAIVSENVVQILDAGEDPEAGLFLVMELLSGEDLERRLEREKRLPVAEAIRIADQAARGLGHAHAEGVIHRDLKPANVFLCETEEGPPLVKIVDFGIAKLVRDSKEASGEPRFTSGGMVVGTPQYMSPEQAQGLGTVDTRTDVYSLGAVLFEMITGQPPVPDLDNYEQKILHIVTHPRPRIRDVMPAIDADLDELVAEMMASDPAKRPPDMRAVRERFASLTAAPRTAISTPPPPPRVSRRSFRHLTWGAAAITAVAIGIAGVRARAADAGPALPAIAATADYMAATSLALESAGVMRKAKPVLPPAEPIWWPHVSAEPKPKPAVTPPPAASQLSTRERPFGGTGISQEF
jgi:serine/threonine-protein kinase